MRGCKGAAGRVAVAIAFVLASSSPSVAQDFDPIVAAQLRVAEEAVAAALAGGRGDGALAEAYGGLGRISHAYEMFDRAEQAYLQAARLAPADAQWPHLLGYLYQQTGRLDAAAIRFADARRLQPANHAATVRLGQVYLGLGRTREARAAFEEVRDVFPALARQGLGEVALRDGDYAVAVRQLLGALERAPDADALHYPLAMAYRGQGRLDDARRHLDRRGPRGIRIGDPIVDALAPLVRGERGLVTQGRRAYEAGLFAEAAAAFARAAADAPASATARFNLGLATLQLGDTPAALGHLQAAFALDPADAQHGRELARLLVRAGRAVDAIDVLEKVVAADEHDEDSLVGLSLLLAGASRYGDAIAVLDGAVRRHPAWVASTTTLARLLASVPDVTLRNGRRALDLATAVYDAAPVPAHAETVAMALAELNRCADAMTWLRRAIADADRVGDAGEAKRLTDEAVRYDSAPCRR